MIGEFYKLLIKAGADKALAFNKYISFEEMGMIQAEKLYLFNIVEDKYQITIKDNAIFYTASDLVDLINSQERLLNCA